METRPGKWLKRWQLAVDIVIYVVSASIFIVPVVIVGGDCGLATSASDTADCSAAMRTRVYVCVAIAALVFPFWLRRKLARMNDG